MARSELQKFTGTRRTASAAKSSRSSGSLPNVSGQRRRIRHVVCLRNDGYRVSLERRKIYVALIDPEAERRGLVRVVDESGEDYLYPIGFFAGIRVPPELARPLGSAR
jgi:hypothetical protein